MTNRYPNHAGHSTGQPLILKQQLAMGVSMGRRGGQAYNERCKASASVQKMNKQGDIPCNKGTQREALQ